MMSVYNARFYIPLVSSNEAVKSSWNESCRHFTDNICCQWFFPRLWTNQKHGKNMVTAPLRGQAFSNVHPASSFIDFAKKTMCVLWIGLKIVITKKTKSAVRVSEPSVFLQPSQDFATFFGPSSTSQTLRLRTLWHSWPSDLHSD